MPEPLAPALDRLRPLLLDTEGLVRAVASGRRRREHPDPVRAELRPVELRAGRQLQITGTDGRIPVTRNHSPQEAGAAVDELLAQPFGNWHVETRDQVVQLRVTKRGEAQVHTSAQSVEGGEAAHDRARNHLIDPADRLFTVLGADGAKRRQVDAFLRQLAPIARRVKPEGRPLRVVDLGCGNAYLTMAAHRYLAAEVDADVQTLGVDIRPEMAERNARVASEAGLEGIAFRAASIEEAAVDPEFTGVDIVLALHACDTATDDALALAVRWQARGVLAAPCCHNDVQRQLQSAEGIPFAGLTRHAILRERFADVLTDTIRADLLRLLGYRVEVVEFIDSKHTPRNALIRAVHTGSAPTPRRVREYTDLVASWQVDPALAARLAPEVDAVLAAGAPE
ncbi:SAM-dependent methyltransferase [Kineosporia rhizophila]|uniref:class I SAM-dependent methyltransferase n=1 Tax=Kineosporia rhizophila TaxID=84633 RepID=UPI001E5EF69D|nr:SAM-dependent methyltransferase [Kineosporia rhizophila]